MDSSLVNDPAQASTGIAGLDDILAGGLVRRRLYLVEGVPVEYQRADGSIAGDVVRVIDYEKPENNEFLAVNQFTVIEGGHERRPDIVVFINGLPIAVIAGPTIFAAVWSRVFSTRTPGMMVNLPNFSVAIA